MREQLPYHFKPNEEELGRIWKEGTIIPDTSALLHIYRYTEETRSEVLQVFSLLKDRLWIPHQVGKEYLENRPGVILKQLGMYDQARRLLETLVQHTEREFHQVLNFTDHPVLNEKRILKKVRFSMKDIADQIGEMEKNHPYSIDNDPLMKEILALFDLNVGESYDVSELEGLYDTGEDRYGKRLPPGYSDAIGDRAKAGPKKYGDYILWQQILDKAREEEEPVLFVTNDSKEDWWWRAREKRIAPRPELREEMNTVAGVPFYMYDSPDFFARVSSLEDVEFAQSALQELFHLRERDKEYGESDLSEPSTMTGLQNRVLEMKDELQRVEEILDRLS